MLGFTLHPQTTTIDVSPPKSADNCHRSKNCADFPQSEPETESHAALMPSQSVQL